MNPRNDTSLDATGIDTSAPALETPKIPPNEDQAAAIDAIVSWYERPRKFKETFFVLRGPAGTGKTFTVQHLLPRIRGRVLFTAPTNKATKVLRDSLTTPTFKPDCRTIYSALGLKMEATGEVKELRGGNMEDVDLTLYSLVIVDEGSMVNSQLMQYIGQASAMHKVPVLFLGDPFQLPPVGEAESPVWKIEESAELTKVMRHDNQILTLATLIRGKVNHPAPSLKLIDDKSEDGTGVHNMTKARMATEIARQAAEGDFLTGETKVIAWRNVTVDAWNKLIRDAMYGPSSATTPWFVGERVVFTGPAKDLDDNMIAATDDEGVVQLIREDWHPIYPEFKIFNLTIAIDGTNKVVVARVLHPECLSQYTRKKEDLSLMARQDKRQWRLFWDFADAFHGVRHAYAITAHRSQGSTFQKGFVEYKDILLNRNRKEAFQCLYVAVSRFKSTLWMA